MTLHYHGAVRDSSGQPSVTMEGGSLQKGFCTIEASNLLVKTDTGFPRERALPWHAGSPGGGNGLVRAKPYGSLDFLSQHVGSS